MRVLASGETESGLKVGEQDFAVRVGLDGFENLLVDGDLVFLASLRDLVSLGFLGEDVTFGLLRATFTMATEVLVVDVLGDLNVVDVKLGAGGNDKVLVDASDGHSIDLVGT